MQPALKILLLFPNAMPYVQQILSISFTGGIAVVVVVVHVIHSLDTNKIDFFQSDQQSFPSTRYQCEHAIPLQLVISTGQYPFMPNWMAWHSLQISPDCSI